MGNAPSNLQERSSSNKEPRKDNRRRESVNALTPTTTKSSAAPPSASLASATAQPTISSVSESQSIATSNPAHVRNRSQTIAAPGSQSHDTSHIAASLPKRAVSIASASGHSPIDAPRHIDVGSPLAPLRSPSEPVPLPLPSFSRPPRLPLPIEEEFQAPGSPISTNTGFGAAASDPEADDSLPRRFSVISSNIDEDDDAQEFLGQPDLDGVPKVPTVIEYREASPGERVYVTGTFTDWQRKFRLQANGPSKAKNALSTTLQLLPGTHHIKFLVKDDMVCSSYLPTTVDYTNILVNYIEVLPDKQGQYSLGAPPVPVASTSTPTRPLDIRTKPVENSSPARSQPFHPSSPSTSRPSTSAAQTPATQSRPGTRIASATSAPVLRQSPKNYTSEIPAFLLDLDMWPPASNEADGDNPEAHDNQAYNSAAASQFHRATAATSNLPAPPSLPLFLSKSILNGTTPMKDDSSVLIMPNHTVLNHLATTNIKQGVLATSATTRYKKKFLTTILYKPRSDDGGD